MIYEVIKAYIVNDAWTGYLNKLHLCVNVPSINDYFKHLGQDAIETYTRPVTDAGDGDFMCSICEDGFAHYCLTDNTGKCWSSRPGVINQAFGTDIMEVTVILVNHDNVLGRFAGAVTSRRAEELITSVYGDQYRLVNHVDVCGEITWDIELNPEHLSTR